MRWNIFQLARRWCPTPVLLPGKFHGRRSLVGCSPWGRKESDTTERLPFHSSLSCIGEGIATHSSVLAWRIPGMGEPDGLPSMGSHRVGHDWSDLAAAAAALSAFMENLFHAKYLYYILWVVYKMHKYSSISPCGRETLTLKENIIYM